MMPTRQHIPLRRVCDHIVELLLLVSLLVIFYFTLFPFDFAFSSWRHMAREVVAKFDLTPVFELTYDVRNNILMFLPFGFCIAALAVGRVRWWWVLILATISGGAISSLVEILQVFLGRRQSAISDVMANSAGALVAALVLLAVRRPLAATGVHLAFWMRRRPLLGVRLVRASRVAVLAVWVSWLAINIYLPLRLYHAGWLAYWNPGYPLNLGDEACGGRPWEGTVRRVAMASRAATAEEAVALARGGSAARLFEGDLLFDFDLRGVAGGDPAALADRVDPNRRLRWRGSASGALRPDGAHVGPRGFYFCPEMADVTRRVAASDQFTIVVDAAAGMLDQQGPARIAGLSLDYMSRNLTIAQQHDALMVRIRLPLTGANGNNPELMLDDVFTDTLPRRIVVTYASSVVRVCVDGVPPREQEIRFVPELAVMWRLFPQLGWVFRMGTSAVPVYQVLYRVMVFGALGALLAVAMMIGPIGNGRRVRLLLIGWFAPVIAIEAVQTWTDGRFDALPALMSLVIVMAGSLMGWLWARRLMKPGHAAALAGQSALTAGDRAGNTPEAP